MTDLILSPFSEEHLLTFDPRDPKSPKEELAERIKFSMSTKKFIFLSILNRVTHETLAICSLFELAPGVAEVILLPGQKMKDNKIGVFRILYEAMNGWAQKEYGLHRLQMSISTAWAGGDKWARKLGFRFEGIARGYGQDKQDHAIYAKVV